MEEKKKARAVGRRALTIVLNQLESVFSGDPVDLVEAEAFLEVAQQKVDSLKIIDEEVFNLMMTANASEDELAAEVKSCDEYVIRITRMRCRLNQLTFERNEVLSRQGESSRSTTNTNTGQNNRSFKLPKIELTKFGGDLREWLPFWSQFKKIHEATDLAPEDKIQYLLLATTPNTRARELVESFPSTAENYDKVIDSLKSRFGRDDLLVEVYVRELLKLVLNNAMTSQTRCSISSLYDKIETQLRALETLGINTDSCSAMLYPLVESCLPEELLRVWQRTAEYSDTADSTLKNRLERLMRFLKAEVEGAERITLAMEGFGLNSNDRPNRKKRGSFDQNVSTASGLINNSVSAKCVFCDGNHLAEKCFKAQKLSYEDKKNTLMKKKACFRCAKVGHTSRRCREHFRCVLCGGQHIVLLCPNLTAKVNTDGKKQTDTGESQNSVPVETGLANQSDTRVFLQTLIVKIRNASDEREVRAIIDTGSQRSYILRHVAQDMQYQPKRGETLMHSLFGGTQTAEQKHHCYDVRLMSLEGKFACKFEALDQPIICNNIPSIYPGVWEKELNEYNIQLTDTKGQQPIAVLIGADIAGKIFTGKNQVLPCGLTAMETALGWVLMGKIPAQGRNQNITMTVASMLNKDASIAALWQLDILGITDPGEKKSKEELQMATKRLFEETISVTEDGRYEVVLPWLEGHPILPSNYALSLKRLESTENKLRKSHNWEKYNEVFSEWLKDNVIEEVPTDELAKQAHYLPHRPVIKEDSNTTKIRPVFDASAREKNRPSLNDCLEKGTNLIEQIPAILLRFRRDQIGVTADIKKAFLQISLNPKDRDFLRFLWKTENNEVRVFRHRRVVFGVNASPFLLGATIEHHLKKSVQNCEDGIGTYSKQTSEILLESFYVDNCVTSMSDPEALELFMSEATTLMAEAKFELRGWEYTGQINEENPTIPLLGLKWNKETDTLAISQVQTFENEVITKRTILSCAQRVFDPIGFTSPATLFPKLLLQEMWTEKIGWDVEVKEESRKKFEKWRVELPFLAEIRIPRFINFTSSDTQNLTLHVFCDASKSAYAAVVFLRADTGTTVTVRLLQARARIAPIKQITVPRLELMAATIGARLGVQTNEALGNNLQTCYWTDSTTVLSWITQSEDWAVFVGNRVQEIRSLTSVQDWRHIPGDQNPADLPSRGCFPKQLAESKWWEGPSWLFEDRKKWPQKEAGTNLEEINKEKKRTVVSSGLNVNETSQIYEYFSKYRDNIRVISWMYRFIYNCLNTEKPKHGELSVEEINNAEKKLIRLVQQESFLDKDNRLATLNAFQDEDGILRLETKISRREDLQTFRYPYILPGEHLVVKRLIYDAHVSHDHVGTQGLLSIVREKYWILGGRRTIKAIIATCHKCKRYTSKSFEANTPPLPMDRIRDAACFEVTGVDLAGPLFLRDNKKAWICLFTCAVYRAVHLEIVTTLSTVGFIQAFRRFISRRGRPHVMYSDNGTNFVGTENLFRQQDWEEIKKYSSDQQICWRFNPPAAPWWGGWWERLVGLLKQLLRRVLGRAHLNGEELYTILCDVEAVINSRPLTYISSESDDLIPLTPVMFLRELRESGVPDCDAADAHALNKRFRYLQRLRDDLRKRFRSEYLGQLRQIVNVKNSRTVAVNEIVLIGNDNCKRLDWPLGKVIELIPGKDSKVRLVRVQTQHGLVLRPIQRLYPLEGLEPEAASNTSGSRHPEAAANTSGSRHPDATTDANEGFNHACTGIKEVKCSEVPSEKVSRYGRRLKVPNRLTL